MAIVDTKISDLDPVSKVEGASYILVTKEDVGNFKITQDLYSQTSAESVGSVFITGNQSIDGIKNYIGSLQLNGDNVLSESQINDQVNASAVLVSNVNQSIDGRKTFLNQVYPSGGIVSSHGLVITDDPNPSLYEKTKSLSLAFEDGVYVTGGNLKSNLYVEGAVIADTIESLEDIIGQHGQTVWTDGRDPDLFEGPDRSLALAFENGVYVTGGNLKSNLYVEGTVIADTIESLEDIIGQHGQTVWTDGRDPDLFEGPDRSLALAFENGVYITGGALDYATLRVEGSIVADTIESLEDIIGASGSTVWTDGRDPDLFESPDKSLVLAFRSGVYVTGERANLYVDGTGFFKALASRDPLEIKGEIKYSNLSHFTHHNWTDTRSSASSADEVYLPFPSTADQFEIEDIHYTVAPYAGKIKSITVRGGDFIGSQSVQFEVRATGNGVNAITTPGYRPFIQESSTANIVKHSSQVFEFTKTGHFQKGQLVALSYDSATKLKSCAAVVEWVYDTTT